MNKNLGLTMCCALLVSVLTGCAAPTPVIDATRYARPTSVVIVEPPPLRNLALVGVHVVPNAIAYPRHFSPQYDYYFRTTGLPGNTPLHASASSPESIQAVVQSTPGGQSVLGGAVGGAIGGALLGAERDSAIKAMRYDTEIRLRVPEFDLRREITYALAARLGERGVKVTVIQADGATGPRLRWPAKGIEGFAQVAPGNPEPVDADLLIQVSPIAHWFAPGVLNNFQRTGNIGVVIYNGRTKEFLGAQAFYYNSPAFQQQYARYETLVADSRTASQALQDGMLTLVPEIVDAVVGAGAPAGR